MDGNNLSLENARGACLGVGVPFESPFQLEGRVNVCLSTAALGHWSLVTCCYGAYFVLTCCRLLLGLNPIAEGTLGLHGPPAFFCAFFPIPPLSCWSSLAPFVIQLDRPFYAPFPFSFPFLSHSLQSIFC